MRIRLIAETESLDDFSGMFKKRKVVSIAEGTWAKYFIAGIAGFL